MIFKKVISFIYEKNYFGDRVPLKFGQNWMSKSQDIADIEFPVVVGGWWVGGGGGIKSFSYPTQLRLC